MPLDCTSRAVFGHEWPLVARTQQAVPFFTVDALNDCAHSPNLLENASLQAKHLQMHIQNLIVGENQNIQHAVTETLLGQTHVPFLFRLVGKESRRSNKSATDEQDLEVTLQPHCKKGYSAQISAVFC